MDSNFNFIIREEELYEFWERKNLLSPKEGEPYTVLMPPPNANASLHAGHGMYVVDDIFTRLKRIQGFASLWIPGMDHAGFETQYVYEKHLAKQGKSRMDYDRQTFYENVYKFVIENSGLIHEQFKRLGFLADWKRSVFTLDNNVVQKVLETFKRMERERLVYKDDYIVNYCTHCGTSLAELEIDHLDREDSLYYIKYLRDDKEGYVIVATVRPEPIFADTHLAVNPTDKKNKGLVGRKVINPLTGKKMEIIADPFVDPKFGTGIVKLTPAHDPHDFEVAKKHKLPIIQAIGLDGKILPSGGKYAGLKTKAAREKVVQDLREKGLIEKVDEKYSHAVTVCYKCKRDLEPMIIPNWYIKVKDLKKPVIDVVKEEKVKFYPKRHKKEILGWLEIMHDWPISRQIAWGIRIPVWYKINGDDDRSWIAWIDKNGSFNQGSIKSFFDKKISLGEIEKGLQKMIIAIGSSSSKYIVSEKKPGEGYLQDTDTFDTWFSSGQWPLVTLNEAELKTRFPTDMMGTSGDILKLWVSRMIMFSIYKTGRIPFKDVYLWSMVTDQKGAKMSKSKGNVINPIELIEKYGADAFRASLIFGGSQGGKIILSEDKIRGMRNFANKIWNIGRFINMNFQIQSSKSQISKKSKEIVKKLKKEFETEKKEYFEYIEKYQLSRSFDKLYEFVWHKFADFYIEELKEEIKNGNIDIFESLREVYLEIIKMLHPFMPFVTEAIWKEFNGKDESILMSRFK